MPEDFGRLTKLELMALSAKLRRGKHKAFQAALRARSFPQLVTMLRLAAFLSEPGDDIERQMARR